MGGRVIDLTTSDEWLIVRRGLLDQSVLGTAPASIYSLPANIDRTEVTKIVVSNPTNQNRWFSLWHDDDGSTFDDTTNIRSERVVNGNNYLEIVDIPEIDNILANLGAEAQSANTITLSIYGTEFIRR